MFTLPTELGERIEQALAQRVCTAADGSYIRRSYGRRRAGRPAKYTVHMADGSSFVMKAHDDGAAVDLANKRQPNKGLQLTAGTRPATRTHRYWNCPNHIEGENNISTSWDNVNCPHCLVTGGRVSPFDASGS